MRTGLFGFVGVLLLVAQTGDSNAAIYYDLATGYWYEPVLAPAGITWGNAEAAAVSQGGYLATIQNSAENNFVFSLIDSSAYWTGLSINGDRLGPWLGGYSNTPGTWNWVSGEPFNYTEWYPGQPDAYGGPVQALSYFAGPNMGSTWCDAVPTGTVGYSLPVGYIVEFNVAPATLALSTSGVSLRAMRNSGTTTAVTLSETSGLGSPGFSSSVAGEASISPTSGVVAASGTQSLNLGWSDYTTTGPLTGTVTLSNTTNSADPFNSSGNVISMTGAVVDNRIVTSTSASFGVVHVGAAISQGITLSTTGDDNYYTRVTVANGGTDNYGFLTVSGGSNFTFNSPSVTDNRTISGTANTPGVFNGTVTLTTIGEGLPGESPNNVPVKYSVQVFSGQAGWIGGRSGSWGNPANWQDQVTPSISAAPGIWGVLSDTATLGSGPSGPVTITLDGTSPHLGSLTFSSTAGYTLTSGSGGTLNMDNGPSTASVTVAAGSHVIAAPVSLDSSTNMIVNNAGDTLTVSGPVSGSSGLTTGGGGVVVLSAANTYSGGTTVNAGTLVAANSGGSAVGSGGVMISGGTLQVGNGGTTGTLPAGITNNSVLAFDRSDAITLGGVMCGSGSLVQAGPGTLNLTGTVCNSTIVGNAGQVVLTPNLVFSGNLATGPGGRIQNNSSLQFENLNNAGIFLGGGSLLGNFVNQSSGDVRIAAGQSLYLQNAAPQSNAGLIEAIGTSAYQASFESAGPFTNASGGGTGMIAAQNATLHFDGGLANQASVLFSYGVSNVFGAVTNSPGGNISIAGGAGVTFYGDVAQNGTLVVSTVGGTRSSAVFAGAFSGSGGFTGGGDVFFEGNLRPSDPVEVTFGGNAYLESTTNTVMQLAGPIAGIQYDQINVTGELNLDGALAVELLDGFQPQAGESFQLFDGQLSGAFGQVTLPALSSGLSWDTSNLDTNGTITVVPEPSTLALLAVGAISLLGCAWRLRTHWAVPWKALTSHGQPNPQRAASCAMRLGLLILPWLIANTSHAQIIGFGGNGAGWTLNGSAAVSDDVLTLTDNNPAEAGSGFYNTHVPVTAAFTTTFTYSAGGDMQADGAAFVLQNDDRGVNAVGGNGGALGYGYAAASTIYGIPITSSAAVEFNLYAPYTMGTQYATDGATSEGGSYTSTIPVNLASGDPILVSVNYDGSQYLTETLTDLTTSNTWATTYTVGSLSATTGGTSAYVGFTAGTGSGVSTQTIENFTFSSSAVPEPSTFALLAAGAIGLLGNRWRRMMRTRTPRLLNVAAVFSLNSSI